MRGFWKKGPASIENYFGQFCENLENPCSLLKCSQNSKCIITENEPKCVKLKRHFIKKMSTTPITSSSRKLVTMSIIKEKNHIMMENIQIDKETVRLVRDHPFKVKLVFLCFFSVTIFLERIHYVCNYNRSFHFYDW